jgi:hypothetical protein
MSPYDTHDLEMPSGSIKFQLRRRAMSGQKTANGIRRLSHAHAVIWPDPCMTSLDGTHKSILESSALYMFGAPLPASRQQVGRCTGRRS